MKKIISIIIANLTFVLVTITPSRATEWEFGFSTGLGTGNVINLDFFGSDHDDWRVYNTADALMQITYKTSPRVGFRFGFGLEYLFNEKDFDGLFDNQLSPIAELSGVFHFLKAPKLFDPYMIAGVGFPTMPHVGFGGQFSIKENAALFVELIGSSIAVHNRVDVRAGIKWLF